MVVYAFTAAGATLRRAVQALPDNLLGCRDRPLPDAESAARTFHRPLPFSTCDGRFQGKAAIAADIIWRAASKAIIKIPRCV
jgi:hypothetical protein